MKMTTKFGGRCAIDAVGHWRKAIRNNMASRGEARLALIIKYPVLPLIERLVPINVALVADPRHTS
jgi:hypothetical protein